MCLYSRIIYNPLGIYQVTELPGQMVFLFLDPWEITSVFHNGWTNLHSHQQYKSVPISPHPLQHLLSPNFLMITFLTGMRWYLNVVLIFTSLMTSDDELVSYVCWPHVCLLLKSICTYPSPTFEWRCFFLVYLF